MTAEELIKETKDSIDFRFLDKTTGEMDFCSLIVLKRELIF